MTLFSRTLVTSTILLLMAGVPLSMYVSDVAEIGRLVKNDKGAALVLYCNGPHCGKSKRLAAELRDAGYTRVRRYQLGIPVWHAVGGVCQVELVSQRQLLRGNDGGGAAGDAEAVVGRLNAGFTGVAGTQLED